MLDLSTIDSIFINLFNGGDLVGWGDGAVSFQPLRELHIFAGSAIPGAVKSIVLTFLASVEMRIGEMGAAIDVGDYVQVEQLAHMLKSSSACIGAVGLNALFIEIEQVAHSGRADQLRILVGRLVEGFNSVAAHLQPLCVDRLKFYPELA